MLSIVLTLIIWSIHDDSIILIEPEFLSFFLSDTQSSRLIDLSGKPAAGQDFFEQGKKFNVPGNKNIILTVLGSPGGHEEFIAKI